MCGIVGLVHPAAGRGDAPRFPAEIVRAMTERLRHRGPDGEGFHHEPGLAFGHRRLAVVDPVGGDQPMSDPEGRAWVIFNGEIYNHLELRSALEQRGRVFRTRCDTEVLVHGFLEWGEDLVDRLEGQFAFAVWHRPARELWLFRDRMGQKPLFYARLRGARSRERGTDGVLAFASEAKALVLHPGLPPAVDEEALAAYLTYEYLPHDLSIFRGVEKLPAAHRLLFRDGEIRRERYWRMPVEEADMPRDEAVERFRHLFDRAVERRLMADVPLGIFLSGGIDSSAVAASVVRRRPPETVDTFSIGFDDPSFDESAHARRVARHLGTRHHEKIFRAETLLEVLPRVMEGLDEPFGDASLLPTFLLSEFTRREVTVALGGDGSDELLLGYPTFQAERLAGPYRRLPSPLRRAIAAVVYRLPVDRGNFSLDFVLKSFVDGAGFDAPLRHVLWLGSVIPGSDDDPLHPEIRRRFPFGAVLAPALRTWKAVAPPGTDRLSGLSRLYSETYLAEDILHKIDRASMAVSLEARSPFLDRDLVEFVCRLPRRHKMRGLRGKRILKEAFADRLPAPVRRRKKKGFGMPVARWIDGPLRGLVDEKLASRRLAESGFLRPEVVERLLGEHRAGAKDHRKVLWTLLVFELWRDRYGIGSRG